MIKHVKLSKSISVTIIPFFYKMNFVKTINESIKYSIFLLLSLTFLSSVYAEENSEITTYGPIKSGQTLWDVAKATRSSKDISIEQQIYALYKANPDAFKTGNMNVLPQGKVLKVPSSELILKTSKATAKAQLTKHSHALDVLRVDAKQLKASKKKSREYKKAVTVLQRQLGRYKHKTRRWNTAYLKLVTAKRKYSHSKKRVAKLNTLLLQKATLQFTKPTKNEVESQALVAVKDVESKTLSAVKASETKTLAAVKEVESSTLAAVKEVESNTLSAVKEVASTTLEAVNKVETTTLKAVKEVETKTVVAVKDGESKSLIAVNETNERLSQIQTSLTSITASNSTLSEKVNALTTLNQRVAVLEEELGKNDEILIQLKSSVEALEVAIEKTTDQLKSQNEKHQQQIKELSAVKSKSEPEVEVSKADLIPSEVEEKTVMSQVEPSTEDTVAALSEEPINSKSMASVESEEVTEAMIESQTTSAIETAGQAMKVSFNPEINDSIAENNDGTPLNLGKATLLNESLAKPKKTRNQLSDYQSSNANAQAKQGSSGSGSSWTNFFSNNWIFLVTIINGLILMFVFYWTIKNNSYPEDD